MSFHALMISYSLSQCVIALSSLPLLRGGPQEAPLLNDALHNLIDNNNNNNNINLVAVGRSSMFRRPAACRSFTGPARREPCVPCLMVPM